MKLEQDAPPICPRHVIQPERTVTTCRGEIISSPFFY